MADEKEQIDPESAPDATWIDLAAEAYNQSTTFMDNNLRKDWENNLRHFHSKHHAGSKYTKDAYKYRSRVFRPKSRSAVRNNEAAASAAFFANKDVVTIEAIDSKDPQQAASADINHELLNYRLSTPNQGINWFLTVIGAFQETQVMGAVASYQDWLYKEREVKTQRPLIDPETGAQVLNAETHEPDFEDVTEKIPLKDQPICDLIPLENLRIHPHADWRDPINSSPYVVWLVPMYVIGVLSKMKNVDSKTGKPKWKTYSYGEIKSSIKQVYDSTRMARDGERQDKTEAAGSGTLGLYDIVWVHKNFVRVDDEDWVYDTLGTDKLLSDPKPVAEVYPAHQGERPIVMGVCVIEAHKVHPSGLTQLAEQIQKEINENVNGRLDAGKFVLNKRWFVKRGAGVDLKSITRNVPGGVTLVSDVEKDVKAQEFNDIPGSAFQEQDRLNVDFDELTGTFSGSSIQSNRSMNETVGGMQMLRGNANALTEYTLKVFAETWAEPVLRQIVNLEQYYESDETVLALCAQKAKLFQKYGVDQITDSLLRRRLTTTVNLGMAATDPILKLQNLAIGLKTVIEVITGAAQATEQSAVKLNLPEIVKEVFGFLGYKDGGRFLMDEEEEGQDPEKAQLMQVVQALQGELQRIEQELNSKIQDNQAKLAIEMERQAGNDRRTAAEIEGKLKAKEYDLLNPVVGERTAQ